ncbi:MAG: aminopeptidase P family protein [Candidatus Riflebacteria bacterium]|nr:aminopeptidase P family protein [Candidatus Riflebacteria bacterium]
MKNPFLARQKAVVAQFPKKVDALLVTNLTNVRYLCGFTGSAGALLLEKGGATFFSDFRYQEQAAQEVGAAAQIVIYKTSTVEAVLEALKECRPKTIGVEGCLRVDQRETLEKDFAGKVTIVAGLPEKVRQVKDRDEIKALRHAFAIADRAFARLLAHIRPGRTEREIAARLEYLMRREGSDGVSFPTIIATGDHAACPHAQPTDRILKRGEMLKIDFGATFQGYHSDMTRTVFLGKADKKFREIYRIVRKAQKRAIALIKPGASCFDIDKAARDYIAKKGFGDNFGHGLGHALGLDIHEGPAYSPKSKDSLAAGMVLTVEPGIYLPGWGGIRIEDVFVVTDEGPVKLTGTSNKLLEID